MAKEYIERDAAVSAVRHAWAKGLEPTQYIEEIPAADVVEVVRCKDCKYGWKCCSGKIACQRDGRVAYEMLFEPTSFCSYGERRDDIATD